jgi:transcriptional regulator with XRE-family HTH domain
MIQKLVSPLVSLMAMRGVTQKEIAELLGVTRHTVSNWTTGKTPARLTLDEWDKLAALLGTTIDKLPRTFAPQPIDPPKENH